MLSRTEIANERLGYQLDWAKTRIEEKLSRLRWIRQDWDRSEAIESTGGMSDRLTA